MAVVLNTQVLLDPNNQIAHLADFTGLVVGTEYLISGQFLVADTRFEFHGFSDIALTRNPVGVPAAQTEVPAVVSTTPQPAAASPPATYPFKVNDRLVADNLNNGFEFNAASLPPAGNGGGAGQWNQWVDLSTAGRGYLRQCVVPQAKAGVYDAAEWVQLGYTDLATKKFWFDGTNVGFQNGITIGSGGITVTNPDAPAPYVKLKGDVMTGRLQTPDLLVQSNLANGAVAATINNLAAGPTAFAGLYISTNNGGRSGNIHIHDANPELVAQLGTNVDRFIVWSTSPVRRVGGFTADGWVKSLDARNIVLNDGNYGQMANGDGTVSIMMGGGSNHAYYRNFTMHRFQYWDGSVDWLQIGPNLVTAQNQVNATFFNASNKVNAIWYDLNGALFADRRVNGALQIYDNAAVKRILIANNNVNYHYADAHQFYNRADNTLLVAMGSSIDVPNGVVRVRGASPNGEFQFQDRNGVDYFGWSATGTTAQLYSSYAGGTVLTVNSSSNMNINGNFTCNDTTARGQLFSGNGIYAYTSGLGGSTALGFGNDGNPHVTIQQGWRFVSQPGTGNTWWEKPGAQLVIMYADGVLRAYWNAVWGAGDYFNTSDIRLKDESTIVPATQGLTEILKLNPVNFKRLPMTLSRELGPNEFTGAMSEPELETGFIAQEVAEALPMAVRTVGDDDTMGIALTPIVAAMVNAFRQIDDRLKLLEGT